MSILAFASVLALVYQLRRRGQEDQLASNMPTVRSGPINGPINNGPAAAVAVASAV